MFFLEAEGGDVTLAAGRRLGSVNLSAAGSEAVMLLSEPNVGELGHEHNTGSGRSGLTCRYSEFIIIDCEEWHHIPEVWWLFIQHRVALCNITEMEKIV